MSSLMIGASFTEREGVRKSGRWESGTEVEESRAFTSYSIIDKSSIIPPLPETLQKGGEGFRIKDTKREMMSVE